MVRGELYGKSGIYVITNTAKEEKNQYVGMSKNIKRRWYDHREHSKRPRSKDEEEKVLYRAMRKYGMDVFVIKVLEEISPDDVELMKEREIYWIEKLDTYHNGYNETLGGDVFDGNNAHYGESHPLHTFTVEEVIQCRIWYKEGERRNEIYKKYFSDRGASGFTSMWFGKTWKYIMPEVFEINPHPIQKVTDEMREDIYQKRKSGMTFSSIKKTYEGILGYGTIHRIYKEEEAKREKI